MLQIKKSAAEMIACNFNLLNESECVNMTIHLFEFFNKELHILIFFLQCLFIQVQLNALSFCF